MASSNHASTSHKVLTNAVVLEQIKENYLNFCLQHTNLADVPKYTFILDNNVSVKMLAPGILAFNYGLVETERKSIVLSCGVHGNETAPIEICNQLVHDLLNEKISTPHCVLFIFGNLDSMILGQRFIEENLNRLFTKEHVSNTVEGHRATQIMNVLDTFFECCGKSSRRIHYDLHTAIRPSKNEKFAVYPFLHGKPYSKEQLAFLSACDVNTVLLSQSPTTTFSYYSSLNHNAHAFTVELGRVMQFGENDMTKFTAIVAKLNELLCNDEVNTNKFDSDRMAIYKVNQVINKHVDDFRLHFDDNIANFTDFAKGTLLASETNHEYRTQHDGEAIVFPNANVEIGQRALLTVIPYTI